MSRRRCEIPEDLLIDILLKMPAESVARFRCLSKFYRQLIDSPEFTRKHYDVSIRRSPRILIRTFDSDVSVEIDCVTKAERLMKPPGRSLSFLGCSRGIFCYQSWLGLVFWNPFTGASRRCGWKLSRKLSDRVLGYDAATDDFKILNMMSGCSNYLDGHSVYSSRTGSWSSVEGFSKHLKPVCHGYMGAEVFVEGTSCTHVKVYDALGGRDGVLGFDFGAEKFMLVPLPPDCRYISRLSTLDGCLCLRERRARYAADSDSDHVWMMKEYGVEESWTRIPTSDSLPSSVSGGGDGGRRKLAMFSDSCRYPPRPDSYDVRMPAQEFLYELMKSNGHHMPQHFVYTSTWRKP